MCIFFYKAASTSVVRFDFRFNCPNTALYFMFVLYASLLWYSLKISRIACWCLNILRKVPAMHQTFDVLVLIWLFLTKYTGLFPLHSSSKYWRGLVCNNKRHCLWRMFVCFICVDTWTCSAYDNIVCVQRWNLKEIEKLL